MGWFEKDFTAITQFVIDNDSDLIFWTDDAGNFLAVNEATCQLLGYSRDEFKSMNVSDIDSDITPESHQAMLYFLENNESFVVQTNPTRKDGTSTTLEFTVKRLVIRESIYLCAFGREIAQNKSIHNRVMDSIATGQPLSETLNQIVDLAERTRIGMMGSILVLDDSNEFQLAATNHLSDTYCQRLVGLKPGPAVGSCGTAAYRRESVMVPDVLVCPLWANYLEIAKDEGIRACWSEPIYSSSSEVLGTLAMYFRAVTSPTDVDRNLLKSFARLAGIAIERFREAEKLRVREIRYRTLVQFSAATVWWTASDGCFMEAQESWQRYTGQTWEEYRGFGWKNAIHPDDQDRIVQSWIEAVEMGATFKSYGRLWHAETSEYRHFEVQAVPVIVGGEILEWSGFTTDVHDRKLAEKALKQNERKLRTITNSLPICIGQIDSDYRYVFNNAMHEAFYQKTVSEIQGKTVAEIFGETMFLQSKPFFDAALKGEQVTFEQRHESENGVSRVGETRLVPNRNAEGDVIGVFVLTDDITQRRALEKEVLNVAVREQRRMGQDLHDGIGQELTGLGMIADTLVLALRESSRQEILIGQKLSEGIKRTLRQIKLMARGLNPVDVSASGIRSALTEMSNQVEDLYGIKCSFLSKQEIQFDDDQIATNLFRIAQEATTNAAKHGQAGNVVINLEKTKSHIELSIVDDGCGFDAEQDFPRGMGLRTMEFRAGVIGAILQISSRNGIGTKVACRIPNKNSETSEFQFSRIAGF